MAKQINAAARHAFTEACEGTLAAEPGPCFEF